VAFWFDQSEKSIADEKHGGQVFPTCFHV
jgi:hypothetical protein